MAFSGPCCLIFASTETARLSFHCTMCTMCERLLFCRPCWQPCLAGRICQSTRIWFRRLDSGHSRPVYTTHCANKFSSLLHLLSFKAKLTRRPDSTGSVEEIYKIWPLQNSGLWKELNLWWEYLLVSCCSSPNNFERRGVGWCDAAQSNYILKLGWADRYVVYSLKWRGSFGQTKLDSGRDWGRHIHAWSHSANKAVTKKTQRARTKLTR